MATNPVTSKRSKHIAMRFNFVREKISSGAICLEYCPTTEMIADELTKILPKPQHVKLRRLILGGSD